MSSGEVNRKRINFTNDMISNKGLQDSSAKWIPKNSILVALAGQGKTRGMVATNNVPITTNQSIAAIVPNNELYYEFIYQNLTNKYRQLRLISSGDGTRGGLNKKIISNIDIIIPKFHEQKKIGDFLLSIDNLIFGMNSRLTMYESLKKYLLQNLFPSNGGKVPNVRFADFSGNWEQHKLGEISNVTKLAGFEFTKYVTYSNNGNIIALRGLNIKDGELILNDIKFIDKSDFSKLQRSKLFNGDILFTYVGTVGQVAIVPENNKFYLAPNVSRIRLNSDYIPFFISQILIRKDFYNHIIFPLIATSSQPALSMENIRKININITKKSEQGKISSFLKIIDELISFQRNQLSLHEKAKKYYLQKLFI